MSLIVAGRFPTFAKAESAARQLFAQGFVEEDVSLFFVNPRGQHNRAAADSLHTAPFSFDAASLNPLRHPGRGAIIGSAAGAVVGVSLFAAFTPSLVVAVVAAGAGASVGALTGATVQARTQAAPPVGELVRHAVHHEMRESGVLVAVHATPATQVRAAEILDAAGALAIERASGRWRQGRWADFNPTQAPVPMTGYKPREI